MCNAKNQSEIIVHDRGLFYTLACQRICVKDCNYADILKRT